MAFFGRKDPIEPGKELDELWRMHVFTQDHNGGGQEGALSTFQKRVIQQRCLTYTQTITDHTLEQIGQRLAHDGECLLVFNPHGQDWSGVLALTVPGAALASGAERRRRRRPAAALPGAAAGRGRGLHPCGGAGDSSGGLPDIPAARSRQPTRPVQAVQIRQDAATLQLETADLLVAIDRTTGNLTRIYDRKRGQEWGGDQVGRLYALRGDGQRCHLAHGRRRGAGKPDI